MVCDRESIIRCRSVELVCFFFNDTATTEIYTLSLHDALPIFGGLVGGVAEHQALVTGALALDLVVGDPGGARLEGGVHRSEEHTSELQSRQYLVCRLLLEKKKQHPFLSISHTTCSSHPSYLSY